MTLSLSATSTAIGPLLTSSFLGVGGAAPYSYSMVSGGIGGTINPVTGQYAAPSAYGLDTVKVTDSLMATATRQILVGTAMELLCDIIQVQMGLAQGRVYLWDQKINMPKDSGLFIVISTLSVKPFGNVNRFIGTGQSQQYACFMGRMGIDAISRGPEARDHKEEIILALNSNYAQSQQELNSFFVGKISTNFVNLSEQDGAAILYRYNVGINLQYTVSKTQAVPYYDQFSGPIVTTEA